MRKRTFVVIAGLALLAVLAVAVLSSGSDDSAEGTGGVPAAEPKHDADRHAPGYPFGGPAAPPNGGTPLLERPASPADGLIEIHATASGLPKIGAKVRVYWQGPVDPNTDQIAWRVAGWGETDAGGLLRVPAAPGSYLVSARAPGLARALVQVERPSGEAVTRVEVPLAAGVAVSGRTVAKKGGDAVPLAQVVFTARVGPNVTDGASEGEAPPEEQTAVTADPRGAFRVEGLFPGSYSVKASAPGFANAVQESILVPRRDDLVIEMSEAAFIGGYVLGANGSPAVGAEVTVTGGGDVYTAVAGQGGGFATQVSPGRYEVFARLGSSAGRAPAPVTVAAGATAQGVTVRLGAAGSIAGTVVAEATGAPVGGADVAVSPNGQSGDSGRARTASDGTFAVSRLASGDYDVVVTAPGYTGLIRWGVSVAGGQSVALSLRLKGTGIVEGVVTDTDSRPVEGLLVDAETNWGAEPLTSRRGARTGSDGHYRLEGVAVGNPVVRVTRDGTLAAERIVELGEGEDARADFVLKETAALTGTVTWKDGRPVSGADSTARRPVLMASSVDMGPGSWSTDQFDSAGRYRLSLPPGRYRIRVAYGENGRRDFVAGGVQIQPASTATFDVTLPGGAEGGLSGVVLGPDGSPVPGAWVWMFAGQQVVGYERSDPDGHFTLPLPAGGLSGESILYARNGGQSAILHDVDTTATLTVQLQAAASIAGRVVSTDGSPVQGFTATLSLLDSHGPPSFGAMGGTYFAGDRFSMEDVPAEHVMVRVTTDDGREGTSVASLSPGGGQAVTVTLGAVGHVSGRIIDGSSGQPVQRGIVLAETGGAPIRRDGHFDLQPIAIGSHTLRVMTDQGTTDVPVEIPSTGTLDLGDVTVGSNRTP